MRILFGFAFVTIFIILITSCSSARVIVKDCEDIDGGVKECELIREL